MKTVGIMSFIGKQVSLIKPTVRDSFSLFASPTFVLKGMFLKEWSLGMNKTQVQYDDKRAGGDATTSG